jgi:hypothetical protein
MKKLLIYALLCLCPLPAYAAGGLSTDWGEVIVEGLQVGKTYDLNQAAPSPFKISNKFEGEVTLKIKILLPEKSELKPGYEPITDPAWIIPEKEEITIPAFGQGTVNLKISIPDDRKYTGKKFQFWIWSYTVGKSVGVGLKSRILISIKNE